MEGFNERMLGAKEEGNMKGFHVKREKENRKGVLWDLGFCGVIFFSYRYLLILTSECNFIFCVNGACQSIGIRTFAIP